MRNVTMEVEVSVTKTFRIRIWLACLLIRIAARIAPTNAIVTRVESVAADVPND